ncbi:thioredoxin domain-containing protein [Parabacteroides sp. OttesenSCG-928-G07]|nr:thioredoxin domain-containing protein [Parabacteroides sp. OttesenSCG-928-G07]
MINSKQNILSIYLNLLQVKHTKEYSKNYYEEHPHKNDLYGLSKMLSHYGVENLALRMEKTPDTLQEIETPCIVHIKNNFGVVSKVCSQKVHYYYNGEKLVTPYEEFLNIWSGNVLIGETDENSIEPDYKTNRRKELVRTGEKTAIILAIVLLLGIFGLTTQFYTETSLITSLLINAFGLYISYLLILKQLKINSHYADKICSLIQQGDCNNVLETDAARFLGVFSWSEIGLGYFFTNIVLIVCLPNLYPYLSLINIFALPYTIWSVWYQKQVAKQWCPLCLLVQGILWLLFLNNLLFGLITIPVFTISSILLVGCLYAAPILLLNLFVPYLADSMKLQEVSHELNAVKADKKIFAGSLKSQPNYELNRNIGLLFGNPEAKHVITVVTNPHCNPCEKMHYRIEDLLSRTDNGYCIQYILTEFNQELANSSKLFIAMYQKMSAEDFLLFMHDWYKNGKNNHLKFYEKYPFDKDDKALLTEYTNQNKWKSNTDIHGTPTVLFDGYKLPDKYKVEDLSYFKEL